FAHAVAPETAVATTQGDFGDGLLATLGLVAGFQVQRGAQAERICGLRRQYRGQPQDPGQLHTDSLLRCVGRTWAAAPETEDGSRGANRHGVLGRAAALWRALPRHRGSAEGGAVVGATCLGGWKVAAR